ncbi:MAG: 3'-5' exonuclease [Candidatus Paceibacterota bacterium]|jgi:DNA polymerase III epsilon subunit family exonuclease
MRKHNFAFIDIETTGLNLQKNEIIEIGCVLTTPDLKIIEEFEFKIKPKHLEYADPVAMKINHYNEDDWKFAYELGDAMEIFSSKVKDAIMVGQNVAFDISFIEYAFNTTNIKNPMHYHRLDTMSIAWAKMHNDPTLERFSLREMCIRFGIEHKNQHTGLGDARATYELYKKLMSL